MNLGEELRSLLGLVEIANNLFQSQLIYTQRGSNLLFVITIPWVVLLIYLPVSFQSHPSSLIRNLEFLNHKFWCGLGWRVEFQTPDEKKKQ